MVKAKFYAPVILAVLFAGAAHAQQIQVNNRTVDMTQFITTSVDDLANSYTGLFLNLVQGWLTPALVAGVFMAGLYWLLDAPRAGQQMLYRTIISYVAVVYMLRYYSTPMPIVGIPFSQIFRMEGRYLAATIDIGVLNVFLQHVQQLFGGDQKPNPWNIFEVFSYYSVLVALAIPEIALFLETSTAIVALAIGALLGPIFIALYMWPFQWARQYFWNWIHYMIKYALYRVVASALVFVMANAEMAFIQRVFGGQYSLPAFAGALLGMIVFNLACALCIFRVPRFVADLTGGSAHAGGGVIGTAVAVAGTAARFV